MEEEFGVALLCGCGLIEVVSARDPLQAPTNPTRAIAHAAYAEKTEVYRRERCATVRERYRHGSPRQLCFASPPAYHAATTLPRHASAALSPPLRSPAAAAATATAAAHPATAATSGPCRRISDVDDFRTMRALARRIEKERRASAEAHCSAPARVAAATVAARAWRTLTESLVGWTMLTRRAQAARLMRSSKVLLRTLRHEGVQMRLKRRADRARRPHSEVLRAWRIWRLEVRKRAAAILRCRCRRAQLCTLWSHWAGLSALRNCAARTRARYDAYAGVAERRRSYVAFAKWSEVASRAVVVGILARISLASQQASVIEARL